MHRTEPNRGFAVVHDWAELCGWLRRAPSLRLMIADIDPAVAGWKAGAEAVREGLRRIEPVIADSLPERCVLVWATNSRRLADAFGSPPRQTPAGHQLIFGVRKPFLHRLNTSLAGSLWRTSAVVVGDQWLTDGLLAWRLRARFVLFDDRRHRRPAWAAVQQLLGYLLVRLLFTAEPARCRASGDRTR